ncbi:MULTISPECIES: S1 family peptidase [unclassified Cellulomonas]|uniref:S1 family peptidase n=1 Tax=unclassified Cellulomonas TaxID=2620175 RepID=UPI001C4FF920|nr:MULTISPECIES: S1 family peptidase [unclassified Cellulomonas]MBW0254476.1 S1 family peptidase [Cellulomonas sp. PS-H5]MCG7284704.1 S1 family peptidase [Cellulomonas sp. ACRRI]
MSARWKGRVACLAVGSLATGGLAGLAGTAAFADDVDPVAPTSGPQFSAQARTLLGLEGVEAVTADGDGNVVLLTTEPVEELVDEAEEFVDGHGNVEVIVLDAPLTALASSDVVGGAGYAAYNPLSFAAGLCSVGFTGFTPAGAPAVISAGHCTDDGDFTEAALTVPADDDAGGGDDISLLAELGQFGFSQFGGPGNTPGADGDVTSTDVSVIDVANPDLTLLPAVTNWTTVADLSASTRPVTAVGRAQVDQNVVKSGRTTGFTSGSVLGHGWAVVDGREVAGFMTDVPAAEGDSGGAVLQGSTAVGLVSGGGTSGGVPVMWAADLQAALARTGGYTVAVEVAAPALTGPADGSTILPGATITGTAPADTVLSVQRGSEAPVDVPVSGAGTWSITAPTQAGAVTYTATARSGYSVSQALSFGYDVVPATGITSPAEGERVVTGLQQITGVGNAGETVELTGAVTETAVVGTDGTWQVAVDLSYGVHAVTVAQTSGTPTAPVTTTFQVVPVAPAITSLDGVTFAEADAPNRVEGTGIDGASVQLAVNDTAALTAEVEQGTWGVELAERLAAGEHAITATQTINGATSDPARAGLTITAAPVAAPDTPAAAAPTGVLARTGAETAALIAAIAAVLLLAGGTATVLARRARARA